MGSDKVLQDFPTPASHIDQLLLQTTTSQHQLGNNMCSKGLLFKEWEKVQQQWSKQQSLQWTITLIKGIHSSQKLCRQKEIQFYMANLQVNNLKYANPTAGDI